MKTELKGWLADNTVTTDNKEDKILVLESAGNLTLSDVLDEMKKEDTGLRAETLKHAVDLFQRTVSELVLNGYSVNTGLFRAVPTQRLACGQYRNHRQQRRQNPGIGKRRKPDTIRCTG
ncbi:hypothetical protein F3B25_22920 [Bacteroides fragilis]|nr:hypothetical protein F3B25_22920 [Bacteroides fragilis]